jgi:glycogen debranching enzyme
MKSILEAYRSGIGGRVQLHENGLVWAAAENIALTWMNTSIDGKAQLPRSGYAVEIQALWYNAVCYTLALAKKQGDKEFVANWKNIPIKTQTSFLEKFWYSDEEYLYDYVNDHESNSAIRSNMIIACGLDYSMLNEEQIVNVALTVRQHLLTPRGLRTLSPRNPLYDTSANDEQSQQDRVRMNGAVWVWPLVFYVRCGFRLRGEGFAEKAQEILDGFNEEIQTYCIGSVGEYFDADPPFGPRGAISSALSVGALLQISEMLAKNAKPKKARATKAATATKKSAKTTKKEVSNKKKQ